MSPALNTLGISQKEFLEGTAPLQYVVRASKNIPEPFQISGLMLKPQAGMTDVRMIQPARSLGSLPGMRIEVSSEQLQLIPASSDIPRVMIWQRQLLKNDHHSLSRVKQVLDSGYVLISEFDDDPNHQNKEHNNLNFLQCMAFK